MNNSSSIKGWLSCLTILLIIGVVLVFFFKYAWIIIPIVFIVNLIRRWIWGRRVKKAQEQVQEFMNQTGNDERKNYCEAEFEILDDESENDRSSASE